MVTVERADEGYKEKVAHTSSGSGNMSIEAAPDNPSAPALSSPTPIYATRDTIGSTITAPSMSYSTANTPNTDQKPYKRKQDTADGNMSQATDKDCPGALDDTRYKSKRSVMSSSHP